jgi:hypothetical protein
MRMPGLRLAMLGIGLWVGLSPAARAQTAGCAVSKADEAAVVDTVRAMYAAAAVNDMAKLHEVFAPGAYLFDGGVRYESVDALMQLIGDYRAKGAKFVWHVTLPDVHMHCNEAWVAFVNDGSITMPGAAAPTSQKWLESADLEKQDGVWKIVFFQSTRVPPPEPAK